MLSKCCKFGRCVFNCVGKLRLRSLSRFANAITGWCKHGSKLRAPWLDSTVIIRIAHPDSHRGVCEFDLSNTCELWLRCAFVPLGALSMGFLELAWADDLVGCTDRRLACSSTCRRIGREILQNQSPPPVVQGPQHTPFVAECVAPAFLCWTDRLWHLQCWLAGRGPMRVLMAMALSARVLGMPSLLLQRRRSFTGACRSLSNPPANSFSHPPPVGAPADDRPLWGARRSQVWRAARRSAKSQIAPKHSTRSRAAP